MKKFLLLPALLFALVFVSCDSASEDSSADNQKAAQALKVVNDGMLKIIPAAGSKADSGIALPDLAALVQGTEIPTGDPTMKVVVGPDIDMGIEGVSAGVKFIFTLDGYKLELNDGVERTVTGTLEITVAYNVVGSEIIIRADTPSDARLVIKGGELDGQKVGFKDLEFTISTSNISIGSPVAVKGAVLINDIPVYVDSEILELLMGMI